MSPPVGRTTTSPLFTRLADVTERAETTRDAVHHTTRGSDNVHRTRGFVSRADTSILNKKVLDKLGSNKEVYVTRAGHLARKEERQVGGRIGRWLGFEVKVVYLDLHQRNARVNSENVLNASQSRNAIINFLSEHVKHSLQDIQPAPIDAPRGTRVHNNHLITDESKSLYKEVQDLKTHGDTLGSQKSFNENLVKRSVSFIKERLEAHDAYKPPKDYSERPNVWQSLQRFVRALRGG